MAKNLAWVKILVLICGSFNKIKILKVAFWLRIWHEILMAWWFDWRVRGAGVAEKLASCARARGFYKGVASLGFFECGLKIKF